MVEHSPKILAREDKTTANSEIGAAARRWSVRKVKTVDRRPKGCRFESQLGQ